MPMTTETCRATESRDHRRRMRFRYGAAGMWPPSSVGFSFCVRGEARLRIEASAARYEADPDHRGAEGRFRRPRYQRTVLEPETMSLTVGSHETRKIWRDRAGIDLRARLHGDGHILTVTLFNRQTFEWDREPGHRTVQARREFAVRGPARVLGRAGRGRRLSARRSRPAE